MEFFNKMKFILLKCSLILLCVFLAKKGWAQTELERATAMLVRVKNAYDSGSMSFRLRYTYASADQPAMVTDSLLGEARFCGTNSYMSLGNIIFFRNKSFNISVFRDDKLIMLSKPSIRENEMQMPTDYLTTVLKNTGVTKCSIKRAKQLVVITLEFAEAATCKFMEVVIDEPHSLITSMMVKVKKPGNPGANEPLSGEAQYAIVRTEFSGFKVEPCDPAGFDENIFFTRKGDVFKPAPKYADYQVFLASPNI